MREIKFRGRATTTGEWIYGYYEGSYPDYNEHHIHCWMDNQELTIPVDPETVGEYTGLVDNKGTEVYEGDILKAPGHPEITKKEYLNQKYQMEWDSVHAKWWAKPLAKKHKSALYLPYVYKDAFIVGNIHDK